MISPNCTYCTSTFVANSELIINALNFKDNGHKSQETTLPSNKCKLFFGARFKSYIRKFNPLIIRKCEICERVWMIIHILTKLRYHYGKE